MQGETLTRLQNEPTPRGEELAAKRQALGLRQRDLARLVGVSPDAIKAQETERRSPQDYLWRFLLLLEMLGDCERRAGEPVTVLGSHWTLEGQAEEDPAEVPIEDWHDQDTSQG